MNESIPARFRITYAKGPAMRFTGHLDLQRTWERTFRRAGLPLTHSQGYNPRPKLQLSPALPLGCTSECEMIDIWMDSPLSTDEVLVKTREAAPPGIKVWSVEKPPPDDPALQNQVTSVEYHISLPEDVSRAELMTAIERLLEEQTIPRSRRGKTYDLRPLVERLGLSSDPTAVRPILEIILASREGATGRPEEVLLELGLDPADCLIHRIRMLTSSQG
jgi:radical SAM-linked protein